MNLGLLILLPQLALAHAHLIEAHPSKDEVVHQAPTEVSVKFSEELEVAMSKLEVLDLSSHKIVSTGSVKMGEKNILVVALSPLKSGKTTYRVSWKAVAKDSHSMKGTYDFTVDSAVDPARK